MGVQLLVRFLAQELGLRIAKPKILQDTHSEQSDVPPKVMKAIYQVSDTKQLGRVSSWLWSVATNLNPSKVGAQDNKVLIQQPDCTVLHPSILKGFHPKLLAYLPGDSYGSSP